MVRIVQVLIVASLAWGVLAFGSPYPWAFWPLAGACALTGVLALFASPKRDARPARAILFVMAPVIAAIVLQLVPLSLETLANLSPATDRFLRRMVVGYTVMPTHPLSIEPASTQTMALLVAAFTLFAAGTARFLGRIGTRWLGPALVGLGLVVALVGIVQAGAYLGQPVTHLYGFWQPEGGTPGGTFGPFVNRNHFAGWMLLALPVGVGFLVGRVARLLDGRSADWHQRFVRLASPEASSVLLTAFGLVVMALSLVLTFSRSGITCLALSLAGTGLLILVGPRGGTRQASAASPARPAARRALVAYLVFLAVVSAGWAGVDAISERFSKASGDLEARVGIWRDTTPILADFPLFGTGIGTYSDAMVRYQKFEMDTWTAEAHNDWLQLAAEGGVLVTVPALIALGVLVWQVRRRFREGDVSRTSYWMRVGAVTGLVAIGLQEIVEFSLQMPGNAALFALLWAIALHRED